MERSTSASEPIWPTRSRERRKIMQETTGVSEQSLYKRGRPRALRRSDRGTPRILPQDKMEYYRELVAALKGVDEARVTLGRAPGGDAPFLIEASTNRGGLQPKSSRYFPRGP